MPWSPGVVTWLPSDTCLPRCTLPPPLPLPLTHSHYHPTPQLVAPWIPPLEAVNDVSHFDCYSESGSEPDVDVEAEAMGKAEGSITWWEDF